MKQLIQKYEDGGKNWVEKYYYPLLNKGFEFLKEYPGTFLDKNLEPIIGIHPYNFVLNRLQRRATNTDAPAIVRYAPPYMVYDYINEKYNNQPNQIKKQNTFGEQVQNRSNSTKQATNVAKRRKLINYPHQLGVKKDGGKIIKALKGISTINMLSDGKNPSGKWEIIEKDPSGKETPYIFDITTGDLTSSLGKETSKFSTFDLMNILKIEPRLADTLLKKNYMFTKSGTKRFATNQEIQEIYNTTTETSAKSQTEEKPQAEGKVNDQNGLYYNGKPIATPDGFGIVQNADGSFGFQALAKLEDQNKNGQTPEVEAAKQETIQPEAPTYESLVGVNTASMNGNINSGNFRKQYRKAFNKALLNGTIYGANNPNGTLVFDSNAIMGYDEQTGKPIYATAANIIQRYGLDGKISRRDMRMLRKDIIGNQNQVRMNNINNFLGITSPAVTSPAAEEVVSTQPVNNNVYDPTGKSKAVQDGTYGSGGYNPLEDESIKSKNQFAT